MPNIKKVLANVAQSLTNAEKAQARDNIGIPKYMKLVSYDTAITDINDAGLITQIDPFKISYYHDNGGQLRLVIENMDMDGLHSVIVSSSSSIETHDDAVFGTKVVLSVGFSNGVGAHQDLRFIVDGTSISEFSIQWIQSATPGDSQLWYKV